MRTLDQLPVAGVFSGCAELGGGREHFVGQRLAIRAGWKGARKPLEPSKVVKPSVALPGNLTR